MFTIVKYSKSFSLVFLIAFIFPVYLSASYTESIKFNRLTIEEGLSNNNITDLKQDNNGFMWFATFDGLNRYDGYGVKVYRHDKDDPTSISGNQLRKLYKDRDGNIWIGAWGDGLNRFIPETETFIRYKHDPKDPNSISHNAIGSIYQDSRGILWIGTRGGGLNRLDQKSGNFIRYRHNPNDSNSLGDDFVVNIQEDSDGVLWISTYGGLNSFNPETKEMKLYTHNPDDPNSISDNNVIDTYIDKEGILWIGTQNGFNRFDKTTETFTRYMHNPKDSNSLGYNYVTKSLEDKAGNFWVFLYGKGAVDLFDPKTGTFQHFPHDPTDSSTPSSNNIFEAITDSNGMIWMGTYGGGASYCNPNAKKFQHFKHKESDPLTLSHNTVRPIHASRSGAVWIGTLNKGLNRLDPKSGKITRFLHDPKDDKTLSSNNIRGLYEDSEGILWVGTYGGGLNRYDPKTKKFTRFKHDPKNSDSLSNNRLYSVYEDRKGILWVGTWTKGLNILDRKTGKFIRMPHDPKDEGTISHNGIVSFYEDTSDNLWIGTYGGGLNLYNREKNTFIRYQHDPKDPNSISHNIVFSIYEDKAGNFWLATGAGLNKMDRKTGKFSVYTVKDGLPNDVVYGIAGDKKGNLWLSTNQGISKFDPKKETFRNYDQHDGLQGNQFNSLAYAQTDNGQIFFGGSNGLTAFYPERIKDNLKVPPVVITNLLLDNKEVTISDDTVLKRSILDTEHITLSYLDRIVSFEFTALNFQSPQKNQYKYKLEGFDDNWIETDSSRRFATYTNLDAGEYRFRVIGSNNDGIWNEKGVSLKITVTPPWWETLWFKVSMALFIVFIISYWLRARIKAVEKQREELKVLVNQKTSELKKSNDELLIAKDEAESANRAKSTFLANMSHELRTPLNAILGFSQLMSKDNTLNEDNKTNLEIINSSGNHLLNLINDVLDMSKIEAGRVELELEDFDLGSLILDIENMMKIRTRTKGLNLIFEQSSDFPRFIKGDAAKIRQILTNLITNAVKFTHVGGISMRLDAKNGDPKFITLRGEIQDSGIGIKQDQLDEIFLPFKQFVESQDQRGTGLGLAITKQFVEMMDGEISVESTPGKGSTFYFNIKVQPARSVTLEEVHEVREVIGLKDPSKEWRILIVEDQIDNQLLLKQILEKAGFSVKIAVNGQEGVELFKEWKPHFIWMDRRMPVMDGLEATKRIKALPDGDKTIIAALTASVFKEQKSEVLAAGSDDFIRKPYQPNEIYECMAKHLNLEYIYKEQIEDEDIREAYTQEELIEMLKNLDSSLVEELHRVLVIADMHALKPTIEKINEYDPKLAAVIEEMKEQYNFQNILKALETINS